MSNFYSLETRTEMFRRVILRNQNKGRTFSRLSVIVLISSCQTLIQISCLACCGMSCRTKCIPLFLLLWWLVVTTIASWVTRDGALVAKFWIKNYVVITATGNGASWQWQQHKLNLHGQQIFVALYTTENRGKILLKNYSPHKPVSVSFRPAFFFVFLKWPPELTLALCTTIVAAGNYSSTCQQQVA